MKERKIVMLTHPTLDQMQALGLAGMAAAYRQLAEQDNAADLSRDEWLGLMLDREAAMRADRRLTNRLAAAKLRFVDACIEDIDFASRRGLDRRNTLQLAQGAWLKAHENFIITGSDRDWQNLAGVCLRAPGGQVDHSVLYLRMPRLFEDLAMARLDGRFPRLIDKLARVQLLILDDWGPTPSMTSSASISWKSSKSATGANHPDYRPAARCPMARHDRRANHRGCDPRPDHPQLPPYRPRRRQHAKEKSLAPLDRNRKQRNQYQLTSTTRQPKASAATLSAI